MINHTNQHFLINRLPKNVQLHIRNAYNYLHRIVSSLPISCYPVILHSYPSLLSFPYVPLCGANQTLFVISLHLFNHSFHILDRIFWNRHINSSQFCTAVSWTKPKEGVVQLGNLALEVLSWFVQEDVSRVSRFQFVY